MRMQLTVIGLIIVAVGSGIAEAQLDPSSALLLNTTTTVTNGSPASSSGRYTTRPRTDQAPRREEPRPVAGKRVRSNDDDSAEMPQAPVTVTVPGQAEPPRYEESRDNNRETTRVYVVPAPQSQRPVATIDPQIEVARKVNFVDLNFSPGFLYTNSSSDSFYRNYTTAAPTLNVESNVWLSEGFGLHGGFMGTLSGHVRDSVTGLRNVPASHQWFTAGVRARRYFGSEITASSLMFGLDYYEYEFRVPSDAAVRSKLRSTGPQLSIEGVFPVNAQRSWMIGVMLAPKLQHDETPTSGDFSSGANVDANMVGLFVGGRFQFERRSGLFWKVSHRVEKDLFSGTAAPIDPTSGAKASGVSVMNSFTLVEFGYAWGN